MQFKLLYIIKLKFSLIIIILIYQFKIKIKKKSKDLKYNNNIYRYKIQNNIINYLYLEYIKITNNK